ncbi:hypothetical protein JCM11641_000842 [Rhodosporidiobolus odoratus]
MPLPSAASTLSGSDGFTRVIKWGGIVAAVLAARKWSAGYRSPPAQEGELAGKTYILVGGFSSTGISIFSALALRGAQVIALHPDPLAPHIVQLLLLLRSTVENERLYAEECDLSSMASIRKFVTQWQRDARGGMMQDLEARVEGIIFCDGEGAGSDEALSYGIQAQVEAQAGGEEVEQYRFSRLTGRHALVQLLLPTLRRSAATSTSPIRVLNTVNPFYSAIPPNSLSATPLEYNGSTSPFPARAPWVAMGKVAAASVLVWEEFQRRVASTPGSADSSAPAPADALPQTTPILALSVCPGLTRSTLFHLLRASPSSPHFSPLGLLLFIMLYPLIWVFAKSADEAAEGILGALLGDIAGKSRKTKRAKIAGENVSTEGVAEKEAEEDIRRMVVKGGALYREGKEVRIPSIASLPPSTAADLWTAESKLVERLLTAAIAEEKEPEQQEEAGGKAEEKKDVVPSSLQSATTFPSLISSVFPSLESARSASSLNILFQHSPDSIRAEWRDWDAAARQTQEAYDPPPLPFPDTEPTPTLSILPDIPLTAAPVSQESSCRAVDRAAGSESSAQLTVPTPTTAGGPAGGSKPASPASGAEEMTRATAAPLTRRTKEDVASEDNKREKRWEGWETSTVTQYVTNTDEVPTAITMYTTYGESPVVDGGTTTETIYKGADTVTVLGPSYLTLTFYPTTTTFSTSKTTIPTTTKTKTKSYVPPSTATVCLPGDADKKEFTGLKPTHDQSITLCEAVYPPAIVGIGIAWNLFLLRDILYPFKVFTVAVHEVGHVLVTICLGFRIGVLSIDPKVGGLTRMVVGEDRDAPIPFIALPPGYIFSIFIGGLLTFCGFDTLASKIASFIIGLCWIGIFLRVEVPAKIMTLLAVGLMVGLWFVDHAWGLRFYVLFMGVMSSFYVLWDVADDAFFAKQNPCCPSLYFQAMPALSPGLWTMIWFAVSFLLFIGFILAALATWKQDPHAMYCQAQTFLPYVFFFTSTPLERSGSCDPPWVTADTVGFCRTR